MSRPYTRADSPHNVEAKIVESDTLAPPTRSESKWFKVRKGKHKKSHSTGNISSSDLEPPTKPDRRSLTPMSHDNGEQGTGDELPYTQPHGELLNRSPKFESMPDVYPESVRSGSGQRVCVDDRVYEMDQGDFTSTERVRARKAAQKLDNIEGSTGEEEGSGVVASISPRSTLSQATTPSQTVPTHPCDQSQSHEGPVKHKGTVSAKEKATGSSKRPRAFKTRSLRESSGVINNLIQTLTTNFGSLKAPVPASHFHSLARRLRRKDGKDLHKLWLELAAYPYGEPSFDIALAHAKLNRYSNALPDDNSLIKLLRRPPTSSLSEYINASYMDAGQSRPNRYVTTQAPMPNTYTDFWRMIWQERMPVIVTLGQRIEDGKVKMHKYWPDEQRSYAYITVVNVSREDALWPTEIEQKQFSEFSHHTHTADARFAGDVHAVSATYNHFDAHLHHQQTPHTLTQTHAHTTTDIRLSADIHREATLRDGNTILFDGGSLLPAKTQSLKSPTKPNVSPSPERTRRRRIPTVIIRRPTRRRMTSPKSKSADFASMAFTGGNVKQSLKDRAPRSRTPTEGVCECYTLTDWDGICICVTNSTSNTSFSASVHTSASISPAASVSSSSANTSVTSLNTSTSLREMNSSGSGKWGVREWKKNRDKHKLQHKTGHQEADSKEESARGESVGRKQAVQSKSFDFTPSLWSKNKQTHKYSPADAPTGTHADSDTHMHTPAYVRTQSTPATTKASSSQTDTNRRTVSPLSLKEVDIPEDEHTRTHKRDSTNRLINLAKHKSGIRHKRATSGPNSPAKHSTPPQTPTHSPYTSPLRSGRSSPNLDVDQFRWDQQALGRTDGLKLGSPSKEPSRKRENAAAKSNNTNKNTDKNTDSNVAAGDHTKQKSHPHLLRGTSARPQSEIEPVAPRSPVMSFLARKVYPTQRSLPASTEVSVGDSDSGIWQQATSSKFSYIPSPSTGASVPRTESGQGIDGVNGDSFLTVRYFRVTCSLDPEAEPLIVTQLQYNNWPDFGVPKSHLEFLTFRDRVTEAYNLACERHWLHIMRVNTALARKMAEREEQACQENQIRREREAQRLGNPSGEILSPEMTSRRSSARSTSPPLASQTSQTIYDGITDITHTQDGIDPASYSPTGAHAQPDTDTRMSRDTGIDDLQPSNPQSESRGHKSYLRKKSLNISNSLASGLASIASEDTSSGSIPEPPRDMLLRTHSWQSKCLEHAYVEGSLKRKDPIGLTQVLDTFNGISPDANDGCGSDCVVQQDTTESSASANNPAQTQSTNFEDAIRDHVLLSNEHDEKGEDGIDCPLASSVSCGSWVLANAGDSAGCKRSVNVGAEDNITRNRPIEADIEFDRGVGRKCRVPSDCGTDANAKCQTSSLEQRVPTGLAGCGCETADIGISASNSTRSQMNVDESRISNFEQEQTTAKSDQKILENYQTTDSIHPNTIADNQTTAGTEPLIAETDPITTGDVPESEFSAVDSPRFIAASSGLRSGGWRRRPLNIQGRVSRSEGNLAKAGPVSLELDRAIDVSSSSVAEEVDGASKDAERVAMKPDHESESDVRGQNLKPGKKKRGRAKSASGVFPKSLSLSIERRHGNRADKIDEKSKIRTKEKASVRPRRCSAESPPREKGTTRVDIKPTGVCTCKTYREGRIGAQASEVRSTGWTRNSPRGVQQNSPLASTDCIGGEERLEISGQVVCSSESTEGRCRIQNYNDDRIKLNAQSRSSMQSPLEDVEGRGGYPYNERTTSRTWRNDGLTNRANLELGFKPHQVDNGSVLSDIEYVDGVQEILPGETSSTARNHASSTSEDGFVMVDYAAVVSAEINKTPHILKRGQSYAPESTLKRSPNCTEDSDTNMLIENTQSGSASSRLPQAPGTVPRLWRRKLSAIVSDSVKSPDVQSRDLGRQLPVTQPPTPHTYETSESKREDFGANSLDGETTGVKPIVHSDTYTRKGTANGTCLSNPQSTKTLDESVSARRTQSTLTASQLDFDVGKRALEGSSSLLNTTSSNAPTAYSNQPNQSGWVGVATTASAAKLSVSANAALENADTHSHTTHGQALPQSAHPLDTHWTNTTEFQFRQVSANVPPLLVHCSAGLGRSGVYCAVDACLITSREEGMIDVFGQIVSMRQRRPRAVQTEEQLRFIFDVLDACPSETGRS